MAQRLSHRCGGDRRALLRTIHGDIEGCYLAVVEVDWLSVPRYRRKKRFIGCCAEGYVHALEASETPGSGLVFNVFSGLGHNSLEEFASFLGSFIVVVNAVLPSTPWSRRSLQSYVHTRRTSDLPDPVILGVDIVKYLEVALEQLREIASFDCVTYTSGHTKPT